MVVVKGGELLFCGSTCWDSVGRRKGLTEGNLVSPTRLRPLVGVDICFVAAGCGMLCSACFFSDYFFLVVYFVGFL